jgi:hypothetical protein
VTGPYEHRAEILCSLKKEFHKCGNFLDQLSKYQLLKEDTLHRLMLDFLKNIS